MNALETFLEALDEIVYIADAETNEILYMNNYGKEFFGLKGALPFKEENHTARLSDFLSEGPGNPERGKFRERRYYDKASGKTYLLRDTLIDYNGGICRFESAVDISAYREERCEIDGLKFNEELLNKIIQIALKEDKADAAINMFLSSVGKMFGTDRAYIFENLKSGNKTFVNNTYEWCSYGVEPQIDNLQGLSLETAQVWYDNFDKMENVIITELEDIKEDQPDIYGYLKPQKIHSLIVSPIIENNAIIGFYGVDNPPTNNMKSISCILGVLGFLISSLIRRRNYERKLEEYSYMDHMTGMKNRYGLALFTEQVDKSASIGLVYCDANGLKRLNDTKGHAAGDKFIKDISETIKESFDGNSAFRIGGDEFLVIETGVSSEKLNKDAADLAENFKRKELSVAVGAVWYDSWIKSFDSLLQEADAKMYENKRTYYGDRRKNPR